MLVQPASRSVVDALCRYTDAVERHFRESVLEALPARYDSLLQQIEDNQEGTAYDMGASRACVVLAAADPAVQSPSPAWTATCSAAYWRTRAISKSTSASPNARVGCCVADACRRRDKNVELVANDLLIIRYKPIRRFVEEESVLLV